MDDSVSSATTPLTRRTVAAAMAICASVAGDVDRDMLGTQTGRTPIPAVKRLEMLASVQVA
jgi:hypothetical protein